MESRKKSLETILVLVSALLLFFLWKGKPLALYIALSLGAIGIFMPWVAEKIHQGWMWLAKILGWINGRVLLSLLFFLLLTPIAFFARLMGKANLQLRRKQEGSYYTVREHRYEKQDLEQMW